MLVTDEDDVDIGYYVTGTSPAKVSKEPPTNVASTAQRDTWRAEISAAFKVYISSLPRWRSEAGISATISTSLTAAIRYGFHQAAMLGQVAADNNPLFGTLTTAQRQSLIEHGIDALTRLAGTVLNDFEGSPTMRGNWSGVSMADGTAIRTDLATTTGTERNRDGSFTALSGNGSTIPEKFTPENPGLT